MVWSDARDARHLLLTRRGGDALGATSFGVPSRFSDPAFDKNISSLVHRRYSYQ